VTAPAASATPARQSAAARKPAPAALVEEAALPPARVSTAPVTAKPVAVPAPRIMLSTPLVTPACEGSAEDITAAVFGDTKRPMPAPARASEAASIQPLGCARPRMAIPTAASVIPATAGRRLPQWSERRPANGATAPKARGRMVRSKPARPGPRCRARSSQTGAASMTPNSTTYDSHAATSGAAWR
jgi:hypothetical protein